MRIRCEIQPGRTQLSRRVLVLGAFLCLFARLLPWNVAYGLQKTMMRSSDTRAMMLRFDPSRAPRQDSSGVSKDILQGQFGGTSGDAVVYLPVAIAGLPNDSLLKADCVEASMKVPGGKIYRLGAGGDFQPLPRVEGIADTYSPIYLSAELYRRYKDVPVDLEIDYSVTEMRKRESGDINPMRGQKRYASIGLCTSGLNSAETQINIRCLQPRTIPLCTSATLKRSDSSAANPAVISCVPNYAPVYPALIPDGTSRFSANLSFRDPNGVGRYPVQGQDLSRSVVDIEVYEAAAHLQRTLSIPGVKLADWSAQ